MSAAQDFPTPPQPVLIVAGMHRSGTSLSASLLADAGLHIGDQLVGPDEGNIRGHFEDVDFCRLHQRILGSNGLSQEGYTCRDTIEVPAKARAEAMALIDRRRSAQQPWGWKDPRTTLFLELWRELVPESRFLFIFRPPWEVVDSLFRRGDDPFVLNPRFALEVWVAYNRRIRDFVRAHSDRCAVVETAQVAVDPAGLIDKAARLLAVPLNQPAALFEPRLLASSQEAHRQGLITTMSSEAIEILHDLRCLTESPPGPVTVDPQPADVVAAALTEWSATATAARTFAARERDREAALARSEEEIAVLRVHGARLTAELEAARTTACQLKAELAAARNAGTSGEPLCAVPLSATTDATAACIPFVVIQHNNKSQQSDDRCDEADAAAARAEVAALADQLQAERECFEALRLDLDDRLETVIRRISDAG